MNRSRKAFAAVLLLMAAATIAGCSSNQTNNPGDQAYKGPGKSKTALPGTHLKGPVAGAPSSKN